MIPELVFTISGIPSVSEIFEDNGVGTRVSPAPDSLIETSRSGRAWYSLREVLLITAYRVGKFVGAN